MWVVIVIMYIDTDFTSCNSNVDGNNCIIQNVIVSLYSDVVGNSCNI